MKRQILILSLFMFLIWNNAYTQESTQQKQVQFGLGIGISDIQKDIAPVFSNIRIAPTVPNVFLPINISPKLRVEPEIGYIQTSNERTNYESSSKIFSIGLGIFPMTLKCAINIYYGARIGFIHATSQETLNGESYEGSGNGFYVAPTIGGEYYLSNSLTFGGESQLRYVSYKEKDKESTSTFMGTRTIFFIRVYF
ncbi:MAG: outer membrane beta-barrel protein [Candidatus Marinimicrobia bacterium]|nr:outer membrane beta-barrel protein [Candidatus Neomarinimicrobiota bacterium]